MALPRQPYKWEDLETKYNLKFKLKDGSFRPVNEWLDDLYLKFGAEEIGHLLSDIYQHGGDLFADVLTHKE